MSLRSERAYGTEIYGEVLRNTVQQLLLRVSPAEWLRAEAALLALEELQHSHNPEPARPIDKALAEGLGEVMPDQEEYWEIFDRMRAPTEFGNGQMADVWISKLDRIQNTQL